MVWVDVIDLMRTHMPEDEARWLIRKRKEEGLFGRDLTRAYLAAYPESAKGYGITAKLTKYMVKSFGSVLYAAALDAVARVEAEEIASENE